VRLAVTLGLVKSEEPDHPDWRLLARDFMRTHDAS
jgi:hypothetical protein